MYSKVFPRLFNKRCVGKFCDQPLSEKLRNKRGLKAMLKQNFTDMLFNQPFLYFPAFYIVKEALMAADEVGTGMPGQYGSLPSLLSLPVSTVVSNALEKYRPNMVSDVTTMSMFWFPVNMVNYSIPVHLRLPAVHMSSLLWSSYMSIFKGGRENSHEKVAAEVPLPSPVISHATHTLAYCAKEAHEEKKETSDAVKIH